MDPFTLALLGGAVGGLLDKKNPLRGAAMGAAGGYFAPGLMAGGGAAGGGLTAGVSGTGGLQAGAAASVPTSGSMYALGNPAMAAGEGGLKLASTSGFAPGATDAGGLLGQMKSFGAQAKPFIDAAGTAMQVQGMFQEPPPPVAQSSLPQRMPMDLSGLFSNNQVAQMKQQRLARRGLLG